MKSAIGLSVFGGFKRARERPDRDEDDVGVGRAETLAVLAVRVRRWPGNAIPLGVVPPLEATAFLPISPTDLPELLVLARRPVGETSEEVLVRCLSVLDMPRVFGVIEPPIAFALSPEADKREEVLARCFKVRVTPALLVMRLREPANGPAGGERISIACEEVEEACSTVSMASVQHLYHKTDQMLSFIIVDIVVALLVVVVANIVVTLSLFAKPSSANQSARTQSHNLLQ